MDQEVNNDSDRSALMYYTIAHDKSELPGNRRSAKQMYEHKYGSIDEPFGWNPRMTFGGSPQEWCSQSLATRSRGGAG